jgi:hypothetical protein
MSWVTRLLGVAMIGMAWWWNTAPTESLPKRKQRSFITPRPIFDLYQHPKYRWMLLAGHDMLTFTFLCWGLGFLLGSALLFYCSYIFAWFGLFFEGLRAVVTGEIVGHHRWYGTVRTAGWEAYLSGALLLVLCLLGLGLVGGYFFNLLTSFNP